MSFKYFAYGSNLLSHRLSINCPSLKKYCLGKLPGFSLTFGKHSDRWKGGVASIIKTTHSQDEVWGVIWDVSNCHMEALDAQEGVTAGGYKVLEVEVVTEIGESIKCRTYQLLDTWHEFKEPSPQYQSVIVDGAKENGLPDNYIEKLEKMKNNGNSEITDMMMEVQAMKTRQHQQTD